MRTTVLIAGVLSCWFLATDPADARPRGGQVAAKTTKPAKKKRATKAPAKKPAPVVAKATEEAPVVKDEKVAAKVEPAPARRRSAAQATDDEVPRNEPRKR